MPELPDVELFRRYLESTALHQRISGVHLASSRLLRNTSEKKLRSRLSGQSLDSSRRHGKHLFAVTESGASLLLHFGMTGFLAYYKGTDDPDYSQLILRFQTGYSLAYINKRMLGRIGLVEDIPTYIKEESLGPDALELEEDAFAEIVRGGRGSIKSTLMNQDRISGLGNVYVDEILYAAGIDPRRTCGELSDMEIDRIFESMLRVVDQAIEANADPAQMPRNFLLPHREEGAPCPACDGRVNKITISGRSTYFCPSCQK